jgi:DNA-binding HxlR family transcriptional regulator
MFGPAASAISPQSSRSERRLLSERLKELEEERRRAPRLPRTPVRIEYVLTDKGRALQEIIAAVSSWAETWVSDADIAEPVAG